MPPRKRGQAASSPPVPFQSPVPTPEPPPSLFRYSRSGHAQFCPTGAIYTIAVLVTIIFFQAWMITTKPSFAESYNQRVEELTRRYNEIVVDLFKTTTSSNASYFGEIGYKLRTELNYTKKHGVVIVPGIVSTGLELWEGFPCAQSKYFRKRVWGTITSMEAFITNNKCWLQHVSLSLANDGLDPDSIKLRPAQGLEAADYLFGNYFLWARLIAELSQVGYDSNSIFMASYDWRLSVDNMEKRDFYFTKLKLQIELLYHTNGREKVVIVSHSFGSIVTKHFLGWVRDDKWVDKHISDWINIGGPLLGVPKTLSSLMSGEMRDTAQMGAVGNWLSNALVITAEDRWRVLRTWAGLPIGGDDVWGDSDVEGVLHPIFAGAMIVMDNTTVLGATAAVELLLRTLEPQERMLWQRWFPHLFRGDGGDGPRKGKGNFMNSLESPLPFAPRMNHYCLYGVGKSAERAFFMVPSTGDGSYAFASHVLDAKVGVNAALYNGSAAAVAESDGDGTVPLLSLGYMCEEWRAADSPLKLNPASMRVVTREYQHRPVALVEDIRGGASTGDHVDILGNHMLLQDVLAIVTGHGQTLQDVKHSQIEMIYRKIRAKETPTKL